MKPNQARLQWTCVVYHDEGSNKWTVTHFFIKKKVNSLFFITRKGCDRETKTKDQTKIDRLTD